MANQNVIVFKVPNVCLSIKCDYSLSIVYDLLCKAPEMGNYPKSEGPMRYYQSAEAQVSYNIGYPRFPLLAK